MRAYICVTCGVQYEPSETPPIHCPICEDDRQYVNAAGQSWTTLESMSQKYKNVIDLVGPGVYAIYSTPAFAIGHRAHLVTSPGGNILWDCITHLDAGTIALINALGGIKAIAVSHPHYFSTIVEWSRAFGNIPVYINGRDAEWLGREHKSVIRWNEELVELWDGMQLIRCGGHFPGASVLLHPQDKGSLFVGDTLQVAPDLKTVSFMYSYPNLVPLPKKDILTIRESLANLQYDRIYGAFGRYIKTEAKNAVNFSINRYLKIYE